MKRLVIFLVTLVAMVTVFALTVNADSILMPNAYIQSVEPSAGNIRADMVWNLFNGNKTSTGIYSTAGEDWFGNLGDTVTIVFTEELEVNKIIPYVSGNWCELIVRAYNANDEIVVEGRAIGNNGAGVEHQAPAQPLINLEDDEEHVYGTVLVKKIVLTVKSFKWGDPKTLKVAELEVLINHDHNYNIPSGTLAFPTCVEEGVARISCSCGYYITEPIEPTGIHNIQDGILSYPDGYHKRGVSSATCTMCGLREGLETYYDPLLVPMGYSVCEFGSVGLAQGFYIDRKAIDIYSSYLGTAFEFGAVTYVSKALPKDTLPLSTAKGTVAGTSSVVLMNDITNAKCNYIEIKISGLSEKYADLQLVLSAYIYDGYDLFYLSENSMTKEPVSKSYTDILSPSDEDIKNDETDTDEQ